MRFLLPILVLASGCSLRWNDPNDTLVQIHPYAGNHEPTKDLGIRNLTGAPILCTATLYASCVEDDPSRWDFGIIEDGESVVVEDVECADMDVACYEPGWDGTTLPLRVWTWFVHESVGYE